MASARDEIFNLVIIGAGWSGLLACKHAKEEHLTVRVLEKRNNLGGVWNFSPDPDVTTVMRNTGTSSSSTVTEMSDFPMPREMGDFPKHRQILDYLDSYAEQFDLRKYIHFQCGVTKMQKENGIWYVTTDANIEYQAKNVMICTGVHQQANRELEQTLLKDYAGEIFHAGSLKEFKESHRQLNIMLIGGGETASDILDEWYPHAKSIVWCIPRGQHFFRKYGKLLPHRAPQALDKASSRALKFVSPQTQSKPGLAWVCRWTTNGSLLAYQGHGIPEFRNDSEFFHSFINKHAHTLDYIDYKKVIPKGPIDSISGKTVYFCDGTSREVDVIIQCTGYKSHFPFLPQNYQCNISNLYKFVYDIKDPSLSYVGYVRPIVGSIPGISEMTSRWVVRVIAGKLSLANHADRTRELARDQLYWKEYFKSSSRRIGTLVDGYTYLDDIAKLSNCYPNYYKLFKDNPRDFFTAYFAPYNGCSYLLNDPDKRDGALETLKRHSKGTITSLNLITILIFRMIMFDWFCDLLGRLKYKIQTNRWWRFIHDWKIIRFADCLWCTPKRWLFDNSTR